MKSAYIIPRLKKPDLDDNEARNYRPISNLPVLAKLLERPVAKQLIAYLKLHGLLLQLKSAHRAAHSTETALLKVTSDNLSALDKSDLVALTLLDLSAAFDCVDLDILLRRMCVCRMHGISGVVSTGSGRILLGGNNMRGMVDAARRRHSSNMVFHKSRSLDRFYSSCTLLTLLHSFNNRDC